MNNATVKGKVHLVEPTKTFGQKGFRKRLVVVEQDLGRFVNFVPLDFIGDACDSADQLQVGDEIEVQYRLSGRKWQRDAQSETKFFLSAEVTSYQPKTGRSAPASSTSNANEAFDEASFEDGDDVPF